MFVPYEFLYKYLKLFLPPSQNVLPQFPSLLCLYWKLSINTFMVPFSTNFLRKFEGNRHFENSFRRLFLYNPGIWSIISRKTNIKEFLTHFVMYFWSLWRSLQELLGKNCNAIFGKTKRKIIKQNFQRNISLYD